MQSILQQPQEPPSQKDIADEKLYNSSRNNFFTLNANSAKAEAGCYNDLLASSHYIEPNETQKACFLATPEFAQAISVLCTEDQNKLSESYLKVLAHSERMGKALKAVQTARGRASIELAYKEFAEVEDEKVDDSAIRKAQSLYSNGIENCLSKR